MATLFNLLKNAFLFNNAPKIIIYIDKDFRRYGRYFINFIRFFDLAGYVVCLKFKLPYVKRFDYYFLLLSKKTKTRLCFCKKNIVLKITTKPNIQNNEIELNLSDFSEPNPDSKEILRIPYSMHPIIYFNNNYPEISKQEIQYENHRKFKIVFAGGLNDKIYKDVYLNESLYLGRTQLFGLLINHFEDKVWCPKSYGEFIEGSDSPICIIRRDAFSLKLNDYFNFLQESNFALTPPGIRKPFSHNLVEAIFNGAIPLMQYPNLLSPSLIHLSNCLAFNNEKEFLEAIEFVLNCDSQTVINMRKNVKNYYNTYLKPESVVAGVMDFFKNTGHPMKIQLYDSK